MYPIVRYFEFNQKIQLWLNLYYQIFLSDTRQTLLDLIWCGRPYLGKNKVLPQPPSNRNNDQNFWLKKGDSVDKLARCLTNVGPPCKNKMNTKKTHKSSTGSLKNTTCIVNTIDCMNPTKISIALDALDSSCAYDLHNSPNSTYSSRVEAPGVLVYRTGMMSRWVYEQTRWAVFQIDTVHSPHDEISSEMLLIKSCVARPKWAETGEMGRWAKKCVS